MVENGYMNSKAQTVLSFVYKCFQYDPNSNVLSTLSTRFAWEEFSIAQKIVCSKLNLKTGFTGQATMATAAATASKATVAAANV